MSERPIIKLTKVEPLEYFLTYGPSGSWLHLGKCDLTRGQEGGAFYTSTDAAIVLRNRDAHACPCMITNR